MEDNQLVQMATQTFCLVPEIYQQAFIDAGADFPDELVAQIKENPKEAVTLLESDEQLAKAVVDIFSNNQEEIMQAAQEKASQQQMFKSGGKLEQGLQMFQAGGLTRRQAIDKAMRVHGYQKRRDARRAYRNAKEGLRREADLRGRELRGEAREFITRRGPDDDIIIPEREVVIDTPIPTAKKWEEAVVTVGDLVAPKTATVTKTIRIKPTPVPTPTPTPEPPKGLSGIEKNRRYMHAWNQYQAERHLFDDKNANLVAGIDPRAYSNFMWKDFRDAYDYDKGEVKSDFYMRVPTQQDLDLANEYVKTHKPMEYLPLNWRNKDNWHSNDINLNERMFYSPTSKNYGADYRADREASSTNIPPTSLYTGIGNTVGPLVMLPVTQMLKAADAAYKGVQAVQKALPATKEVLAIDAAKTPLMIGQGTNNALIPISAVFRRGGVIKAQEGTGLMNRNPFEMQAIKPSGSKVGSYFANRMMANRAKASLNNSMENAQNESINRLRPLDPTIANFRNIRPNAQGFLPRVDSSIGEPPVTSQFENTPNIMNINRSSINTPNSLPMEGNSYNVPNSLPNGGQSYNEPANMPNLPQGFSVPENIKRLKMKGNKIKMTFKENGGELMQEGGRFVGTTYRNIPSSNSEFSTETRDFVYPNNASLQSSQVLIDGKPSGIYRTIMTNPSGQRDTTYNNTYKTWITPTAAKVNTKYDAVPEGIAQVFTDADNTPFPIMQESASGNVVELQNPHFEDDSIVNEKYILSKSKKNPTLVRTIRQMPNGTRDTTYTPSWGKSVFLNLEKKTRK